MGTVSELESSDSSHRWANFLTSNFCKYKNGGFLKSGNSTSFQNHVSKYQRPILYYYGWAIQ